jgi:hypothetical protein
VTDLVEQLRSRTICVPKPGTEPFTPVQPFWVTMTVGSHKAGEEAGLQYLPGTISIAGGGTPPPRVQEHIYVIEPLCEKAAAEIERLTEQRNAKAGECEAFESEVRRLREALERIISNHNHPGTSGTHFIEWVSDCDACNPKRVAHEALTDLVTRLRKVAEPELDHLAYEAADEIERLRAALEKYGRHLSDGSDFGMCEGEYEALALGPCTCGLNDALGHK